MRFLQFASLFTDHLIIDGMIVTSSITFYKYMRYVIITQKPYLFIYDTQCCFSAPI